MIHRLKIEISPISVSPKFSVKRYGYRVDFEKKTGIDQSLIVAVSSDSVRYACRS